MKRRKIATHSLIRDIAEELRPYVQPYAISIEDNYEIDDDTGKWVRDEIRLWVRLRPQVDKQDVHMTSTIIRPRQMGVPDTARYCAGSILGDTPKEYFLPGMHEKFHEKDPELEIVLDPEEEKDPFEPSHISKP